MKFYNKKQKNTVILNLIVQARILFQNLCFAKSKKSAMFGLDARIALAIFGALSVITGAALYSAISNAKATALLTEMQELAKAYEQMYLDTASHIPVKSTFAMKTNYLVENPAPSISGWKGPYIALPKGTGADETTRLIGKYARLGISRIENNKVWGNGVSPDPVALCEDGDKCSLWMMVLDVKPEIIKKIDEKIDGEIGVDSGRVRYNAEITSYFFWNFFPYQ